MPGGTSFVSVHLLRGAQLGFLAIPQFDQFEHIEKPWISPENKSRLYDLWKERQRQSNEWGIPTWPQGWQEEGIA